MPILHREAERENFAQVQLERAELQREREILRQQQQSRRTGRLDLLERQVEQIHHIVVKLMEKMMALEPHVQKIVDDTVLIKAAMEATLGKLTDAAAQVADLKTQLGNIQPGVPVDAENAAALQTAAESLEATIAEASGAAASAPAAPADPTAAAGGTTLQGGTTGDLTGQG